MNYEALINDLQLKVEEVADKYKILKEHLQDYQDHEGDEQARLSMQELERLVKEIHDQFAQVQDKEKLNEQSLSRIEKTIYNIIRSFNRVYTGAASNFQIQ